MMFIIASDALGTNNNVCDNNKNTCVRRESFFTFHITRGPECGVWPEEQDRVTCSTGPLSSFLSCNDIISETMVGKTLPHPFCTQ